MRAWEIVEPGPLASHPLRCAERASPAPGPGQVLLRVLACGVCRTDLHEAEGDVALPKLPVVPGHQVVGVVEAAGPGASLEPGARVGAAWLGGACGACDYCRAGSENLCDEPTFTGLHVDGGYAELMLGSADFCLPLPEALAPEAAAPLLCAGLIGYRALKAAGVRPGDTVGLFGFGGSAHLALQALKRWGCRAFVFTRGEGRRRLAERLGADWAGPPDGRAPSALHRAVSFAPSGDVVPLALERLRKGGVLALAGIHVDRIPELPYRLLFGERSIKTVTAATRADGREFLALAAEAGIRAETRALPLAEANEALRRLKAGEVAGALVLIP